MKQLIQNLKDGQLELKEAPIPLCKFKGVLVRTVNSLISIGTEKSIIDLAKKSLLGKARARPDLFKRSTENAKKEGFLKVYRESKERLDEPFPLDYSASGIVVEVRSGVDEFALCSLLYALCAMRSDMLGRVTDLQMDVPDFRRAVPRLSPTFVREDTTPQF